MVTEFKHFYLVLCTLKILGNFDGPRCFVYLGESFGENLGKSFGISFWETLSSTMLKSRDQIWEHFLWSNAADDERENILTWEQQKHNFYGSIHE